MIQLGISRVAHPFALLVFSFALLAAGPSMSQQEAQPPKQPAQQAKKNGGGGGERIAKVEAQLVDLQVALGSLESLVRNNSSAAAPAPQPAPSSYDAGGGYSAGGGASDARVVALETQIQALTTQLEQVTAQMSALQSRLGGGSMPQPMPGNEAAPPAQIIPNAYEPPLPAQGGQQAAYGNQPPAGGEPRFDHQAAFGSAGGAQDAVAQAGAASDPIGNLLGAPDAAGESSPGGSAVVAQPAQNLAAVAPRADIRNDPSGASPKEIYDSAYRQLMAREYDTAESSFRLFVSSYPNDPLAGEAQYWLGETYYVRGQHKQAADAFLNAYSRYGSGRKAPDSLLKLGLSLAQLKQKDAACSALTEFGQKYPKAPDHLRERAQSERRRAGC